MLTDEKFIQATNDALERYKNTGSDLTKEMTIEFFVASRTDNFVDFIKDLMRYNSNFSTIIERNVDGEEFTCYCKITIIPELHKILEIEENLMQLANKYGCYYDGFGSFGN
ncbi:MAG: ribonuclease E inhibitor RraB [Cardiobacteriaceae bacterium]|nr:ribonuclease E inhibitor RraB [Cardiobacteriaceae bacterium]